MTLLLIILIPWIGSVCAAFMPTNARNAEAWLAGFVALAATVLLAWHYPHLANNAVLQLDIPWSATLGVDFQLRMDGFSWLFAMLISGMGLLVVIYARYYMSPADPVPRFFSFFLAFMGAMLGIVLSGNLLQMAFFWELTSLVSFNFVGDATFSYKVCNEAGTHCSADTTVTIKVSSAPVAQPDEFTVASGQPIQSDFC